MIKKKCKIFIIAEPSSNLWRLEDIKDLITIFYASLTNFEKINSLIKKIKPEIIFHLAAFGGLPNQLVQKKIFDINFYGTVNLFNACKQVGFKCFINTGSSSEYGMKDLPMSEKDVLEPISDYAVAKAASTQFCLKQALFNKLPVYTVRPFSVYGDYEMQGRLIPSVLIDALQNKEINLSSQHCVRDFIYIDDIVNFYVSLSEKQPKDLFIFNCGTGVQSSIEQVTKEVQSFFSRKLNVKWGQSKPRPWEPKKWKSCIDLAKKTLGWHPEYDLKSGLKKSLTWFAGNLHLYNNDFKNFRVLKEKNVDARQI